MPPRALVLAALAALSALATTRADEPKSPPRPGPAIIGRPYRPTEEMKGTLKIAGSTSLSHVAATWSSGLRRFHPSLTIDIDCEGSETALPALAEEGLVAAVSRPVSAAELKALSEKAGKKLQAFTVCLDDLAVVVHPDNPVPRLTAAQLREALGVGKDAPAELTWGRLGLTGDWAKKPVTLHLMPVTTGARGFIRERVLGKGVQERPGKDCEKAPQVLEAVAADPTGLTYYRKARLSSAVKAVPVEADDGPPPLRRSMTLIVPVDKNGEPAGAARELLLYALSRDGQQAVRLDGFTPLDPATLAAQVEKMGLAEPR